MKVSIIVPCYNEQEALPIFYEEINRILESMPCEYEILFIDDGSDDKTLDILKKIAGRNKMIKYISFSRNFGKEAAIYAGFCNVTGDYAVIMDADMQDPPALLPQMLEILLTGNYDSVAARRKNRVGEPVLRSWFARWFYRIINRISDADIMDGARDFRLMKKSMVDAIVKMGEYNRFSKGIFGWIGFHTYWLSYENQERVAGETKWNFWKLMRYALEGIIDFSQAPLSIASWFGVIMTACSFMAVVFIIVRKLLFGDPVEGWASLACIITFIGGVQLFCIGLMGQYIAKAYLEVKKRPHYIISESNQDNIENVN